MKLRFRKAGGADGVGSSGEGEDNGVFVGLRCDIRRSGCKQNQLIYLSTFHLAIVMMVLISFSKLFNNFT